MATTPLQQEILDILKVKMPEENISRSPDLGNSNDVSEGIETLKRSITSVDSKEIKSLPYKKLKPSDPKDLIDDDDISTLNTIELINEDFDDDNSTDSDDISDDDDIEIIKDVLTNSSSISSELLSVVNIISKEVVENTSFGINSLDLSGDTGFVSDDNVGDKISKEASDSDDIGDAVGSVNTSVDDIDCLLLSSPLKPRVELVRNPLYSLGSSTASEDSNSSADVKSICSVESLTLKVSSSSEESSSSSSNTDGSTSVDDSNSEQGNHSKVKTNNPLTKNLEGNEVESNLCLEEGAATSTGSSETGDDTSGTRSEINESNVESSESSDERIDLYTREEDDDIMMVEEINISKAPSSEHKIITENPKSEIKDEKDVKTSLDVVSTTKLVPCEMSKMKSEEGKVKKEESKPNVKFDKSQSHIKSIILVSIDDDEETEDVKIEGKLTEKVRRKDELKEEKFALKPSIDMSKIRKCYVHCEKARIPSGLPIPNCDDCSPADDAEDEIEILDPYPETPCSVCKQSPGCIKFYKIGSGVDEATAVRVGRISVVSWEETLTTDWAPCFKLVKLSIYDGMGHLVTYDGGLIEAGHHLYFSGVLMNIVEDDETLEVDKIGPLTGWRKPEEDSLILITCLEGIDVEYHVNVKDFSVTYKTALALQSQRESFSKSISQALSKVPNSNLKKPDFKQAKVQIKSQNPESDLKKVFSSLPTKTSIKVTPVPSRAIRNLKRKPSGSAEYAPSATSTDDDWSPDRNRPARKVTKRAASPESSDEDAKGGSTSHFTQIKRKVPAVLKTLDSKPGYGKGLAELLPPGHGDSQDAVAAFLKFVHERQLIWINKTRGIMPMTRNKVMANKWFTNMYRELDRGTVFFRKCIIDTVLKGVPINKKVIKESLVAKVVFRSIVYRLINKVETFTDYGGLPDLEDFPKFLKFLKEKKTSGVVLFTAAHQNMGFDRLMKTFEYVKKNVKNLASEIVAASEKRSIKKCQEILLKIPNVGNFFAWQILCDLLEARILGSCTDNQWACLGPGAKNGLRRLFPLATTKGELKYTRLVRDLCAPSGPGSGFEALGLQFPAFLHQPLSLKNVEHALCEYDKYFRSALGVQIKEREYSEQKSRSGLDNMASCIECHKQVTKVVSSRVMCALCSTTYHKKCKTDWDKDFHDDGTWLCGECHKSEEAWGEEDFQYEEVDQNDELGKAFFSGAAKKASRLARKDKKEKKKKVKEIECIDLSSDEEEDDDDDDNEVDDASDEEVEYLEEFFGVDYDATVNEDNEISVVVDEEDPFAGVGVFFTEKDETSQEEETNGLDEEEILILS